MITNFDKYDSVNEKNYFDTYESIITLLKDKEELYLFKEAADKLGDKVHNSITEDIEEGIYYKLTRGQSPYIRYSKGDNRWSYGSKEYLDEQGSNGYFKTKKIYYIHDLPEVMSLINNNGKFMPSYNPKTFITEKFNELLLEKSSLTKLGIPREVMQPIQRDLALSPDAEWKKIEHKKDIIDYLRKGDENLFIQIATDSIKVIVSYPSPKGTQIFVDNYIYKDTGWSGEFKKQKREYKTLTQTAIDIEPRTNIYRLDGDFSISKQSQRGLIKKERSFMDFSDKFKTDFLQKFDKILKRISGTNFEKAKDKVTDKVKKIAMENSLLIKGLDNPLNGPNGLSILDEFLYQFEDEYSEYFEERIDIQELANYFTIDKVRTMFMYYIHTGKILVN